MCVEKITNGEIFNYIASCASIIGLFLLIGKTDFLYFKSYFKIREDKNKRDIWVIGGSYLIDLLSKDNTKESKLSSLNEINSVIELIRERMDVDKIKIYYCCNDNKPIIKFDTKFTNNFNNDKFNRFWCLEPLNDNGNKKILISHQSLSKFDLDSSNIKYYSLGSISKMKHEDYLSKVNSFFNYNYVDYFNLININLFQMWLKYLGLKYLGLNKIITTTLIIYLILKPHFNLLLATFLFIMLIIPHILNF